MGDEISLCSKSAIRKADVIDIWSRMPLEILESISDRLPLKDFFVFRSVCRNWRLAPSGRSEIFKFRKDKPWSMFYGFSRSKCYIYCDSHPNPCTLYLPDLEGATVMQSKLGWLLARHTEHFFFYNCFTLTKINLPKHIVAPNQACTFTTLPTSSDCIVLVATRRCGSNLEVSSCRVDDKNWKTDTIGISDDWIGTMLSANCSTCCCGSGYTNCTCSLKNRIAICGSEKYSVVDYVEKTIIKTDVRKGASRNGRENLAYGADAQMRRRQVTDWLQRFGGKGGFVLNFCALHSTTKGILYRKQTTYAATNDYEPAKLNYVNAVLIEPIFP